MARKFETNEEIAEFLATPRLAILIYHGKRPAPTGVPVWFDWDGEVLRMFAGRGSPKVKHLTEDPNISVLVTNRVGEPEAWVAFDGKVQIADFETADWVALITTYRNGSTFCEGRRDRLRRTPATKRRYPPCKLRTMAPEDRHGCCETR